MKPARCIHFFVINLFVQERNNPMPVTVHAETRRMDQDEFGQVAYEVMNCVFSLHNTLGRFFHEDIYGDELAQRFARARREVQIEVCFHDFRKDYFMDLLVNAGAVFELKAVQALTERHRSQLMNYLLLAELPHGKLINVRPELVQHEFVNALLTRQQRTSFPVCHAEWLEPEGHGGHVKDLVTEMLRDWGTGLDVELYEQAVTHFLGGDAKVLSDLEVVLDGRAIGRQKVRLASPDAAFKITAIAPGETARFEVHLQRFLEHTRLQAIHWINVTRELVAFKTIRRS